MRLRRQFSHADIGICDWQDDEHRRSDEANARDDQTWEAGADRAEMDRQFRRIRPGHEVHRSYKVKKVLAIDPAAFVDDFILDHRHMGSGPAEGSEAEAREEKGDFAETGWTIEHAGRR